MNFSLEQESCQSRFCWQQKWLACLEPDPPSNQLLHLIHHFLPVNLLWDLGNFGLGLSYWTLGHFFLEFCNCKFARGYGNRVRQQWRGG